MNAVCIVLLTLKCSLTALRAHSWRQSHYCNLAVARNLECRYLFKAWGSV